MSVAAACSGVAERDVAFTRNADAPQPFPANHRAELVSFFRTYLIDPRQVREAGLAEPVQRSLAGRPRYVACVRMNARDTYGRYPGAADRAVLFVDGRLDRVLENGPEICAGATYAPFPELEKL
jgi:hypothetical protein